MNERVGANLKVGPSQRRPEISLPRRPPSPTADVEVEKSKPIRQFGVKAKRPRVASAYTRLHERSIERVHRRTGRYVKCFPVLGRAAPFRLLEIRDHVAPGPSFDTRPFPVFKIAW